MGKIMKYTFEDLTMDVEINIKPQNKHIYVRIKDDKMIINSYREITNKDLDKIFKTNYDFIKRKLKEKKKILNSIHLFGIEYELKIISSDKNDIKMLDSTLELYVKHLDQAYIRKCINALYEELLKYYINSNFDRIFDNFPDIKEKPIFKFKMLKSVYGRYNKKEHSITLSLHLAKYDKKYIELVIAHELTHTLHMNHQKEFYQVLEKAYPGAKKLQSALRKTKYSDFY